MSNVIPAPTARGTYSLAPRTFDEALRFSELIAQTAMVPQAYRGKPADILVAIQMGAELGLAPMQALQNISVINGRPAVWGEALIALVRASPLCEDIVEEVRGEGEDMVAICIAKRRGASPVKAVFSVDDAKRAGLWGKPGPWQTYPKRMLQMRARGFALRDAFPDLLRGLITAEEAIDIPVVDVTSAEERQRSVPPKSRLDALEATIAPQSPSAHDETAERYVVRFPNGAERAYDTAARAWQAIDTALERCQSLEQVERLMSDNAALLSADPPPPALAAVLEHARLRRESMAA